MATDVKDYCRSCSHCVPAKQCLPPKVPLVKFPIGEPWKRIAMDVLEVPLNSKGNRYILVVQDYFTKWLEAFPMANQRAETIVEMLAIHFCRFGIKQELHGDQGRNLKAYWFLVYVILLVSKRLEPLLTILKGMAWSNGRIGYY